MIDRTGQTSYKQAINALIRSNYREWGYAVLNDAAEVAVLGADGACSNTTYFNGDCVHLTGPSGVCAFGAGGTGSTGYAIRCGLTQNAILVADGNLTAANSYLPGASTSYTIGIQNVYSVLAPTVAATATIPDCTGLTDLPHYVVNSGTGTITFSAAVGGQTLQTTSALGLTLTAGGRASFRNMLTGTTTGGCYIQREQ